MPSPTWNNSPGRALFSSYQSEGLSLNVFEVELNQDYLSLWGTPFEKETFDSLRGDEQLSDFFFYRFDKTLYAWERRRTVQKLPSGFQQETVSLNEHAPIVRKIVEESLVEYFRSRDYKVYSVKYSSNWEVTLRKEQPEVFGDLSLIPTLVFSVTNLYSTKSEKQIIGLAISKRYVPKFTSPEAELNQKHIDTRDWDRNAKGELSASSKNRRLYLEASNQTNKYLGFLSTVGSTKREFDYLKNSLKSFNELGQSLFLPEPLKVTQFRFVSLPNSSFEASTISKPQYYFHNEKTKTGDYYDKVLSELKPYSFDLFAARTVRILVITPEAYEGSVDEYLVKLRQVLERIIHLRSLEFQVVTVPSRQSYASVLGDVDPVNYDLAIVIVSQQQKKLAIQESPYFVLKAKLLNQRLPTQDLTIEVIRQSNKFINNNIALNVYSKLGGTAWTIEKIEKNVSEFIVGIGSTVDEQRNLIIGFANIFDYNGTYLLGDCSQFTTKANYTKKLRDYLVKQLSVALQMKNISEGESIRLVFHIFKAAGEEYEIKAIEHALAEFSQYSIKYALVNLSYNHNYRVFQKEGTEKPRRGTFIQLATYQALLHLGGKSVVPVLVRLDKRSTYKDIYAITKQVLFFSHLSHRSFIPPSKPVTVTYPGRMAKLVSELKQVPGWDIDVLNKISDKLWFI
jgi:argonaute-like protein